MLFPLISLYEDNGNIIKGKNINILKRKKKSKIIVQV